MTFQRAVQIELQERYRRLVKTDMAGYGKQMRYMRDWMQSRAPLASVLNHVSRSCPEFDPAEWYAALERRGLYELPDTEEEFDKLAWWFMNEIAESNDANQAWRVAYPFSSSSNINENLRDFSGAIIEPFVEHLQSRLASTSDVLYVLERYRRQVAWFDVDDLYARYEQDPRHGEETYDRHLREFLFLQGIDYPFSQPAGPSGKADVVVDPSGDDPLTCEVKLFDGDRYKASYIAKGLTQAVRYAEDYGQTTAHLVVFNLSEQTLELPSDDDEKDWPPRLEIGGVTVFLIVVPGRPRPVASKGGKAKPIRVDRSELVQ